jgi:hypothetical protein
MVIVLYADSQLMERGTSFRRGSMDSMISGTTNGSGGNRGKLNSVDEQQEAIVHAKLSIHKKVMVGMLVGGVSTSSVMTQASAQSSLHGNSGGAAENGMRSTLAQARKIRGLTAVLGHSGDGEGSGAATRNKIQVLLAKQQMQKQIQQQQAFLQNQQQPQSISKRLSGYSDNSNSSEDCDDAASDPYNKDANRRTRSDSADSAASNTAIPGNAARSASPATVGNVAGGVPRRGSVTSTLGGNKDVSPLYSRHASAKERNHAMIVLDHETATAAAAAAGMSAGALFSTGTGGTARTGRRKSVLGSATTILTPEEAVTENLRQAAATLAAATADGDGNTPDSANGGAQETAKALLANAQANLPLPAVNEPGGGYNMNRVPTVVGSFLLKKALANNNDSLKSYLGDVPVESTNCRFIRKMWGAVKRIFAVLTCNPRAGRGSVRPEDIGVLSEDFSDIFFFRSPTLFYRAAELGIMMNCLYMGMWSTNFISITMEETHWAKFWNVLM